MSDPAVTPDEANSDPVGEPAPAVPAARRWQNPLFGFAAIVISVAGLRAFGELLGPLFLGVVLIVTVAPLASALRRRGLPSWLATVVTLLAVYALLLALVGSLVYAAAELVRVLPGYGPQVAALLAQAGAVLQTLGVGPDQIQSALAEFDLNNAVGFLQGLLGQLLGLVSNLALLLTLLFFLAIDSGSVPERFKVVGRSRPQVVDALTSFAHGTRRFLMVSTIFGVIIGVLDFAALTLLGVPLAGLFGLVALISNYIPAVGFLIAMVPPALLALLEGGPGLMLAVIAVFSVINVVFQTLLQPRFIGDAVGLSISVTFLTLVFWGWAIGALGALLAIPLTLLAKALLIDLDPGTRWFNALVADKPRP